jgi:hypothetical protein
MDFWPFGKKKEEPAKPGPKPAEKKVEPAAPTGASGNVCAVCNQPGADKSFGGNTFHKKCLRKTRKAAKGML